MKTKALVSTLLTAIFALSLFSANSSALTPLPYPGEPLPIVVNFLASGWYPGPKSVQMVNSYRAHLVLNHDAQRITVVGTQGYNDGTATKCRFTVKGADFQKVLSLLQEIKTAKSDRMSVDAGDKVLSIINARGVTKTRLFEDSDSAYGKEVIINGQALQALLMGYAQTKCGISPNL